MPSISAIKRWKKGNHYKFEDSGDYTSFIAKPSLGGNNYLKVNNENKKYAHISHLGAFHLLI